MEISKQALDLIINFETGGKAYYEKHYKSRPCWPEGASGVTIGCGVDLGYYTRKEVIANVLPYFTDQEGAQLINCVGLKGEAAHRALAAVSMIVFPWSEALELFQKWTLPKFIDLAVKAFPGLDQLCPDAAGAVLSIVFNRGTSFEGPRRVEMVELRDAVAKKDYKAMARAIRKMKRLWKDNPNSDSDLYDRREAEALLVLKCAN